MSNNQKKSFAKAIKESGLTIYDDLDVNDKTFWIPTPDLEDILNWGLKGISMDGLPLRTRSRVIKEKICDVLGYPIPKSFKKTQPRFIGQNFDTYIQKSNNLQVWNEDLSPNRRYVLIKVDETNTIIAVKVVSGETLAVYDKTGKLTQKYQAKFELVNGLTVELISKSDTDNLFPLVNPVFSLSKMTTPIETPVAKKLYPIEVIYKKLSTLIGKSFSDSGKIQERNRGAILHSLICETLGYSRFQDDGRFPDVRNQLLEVKLQTSPTIDLGLVNPESQAPLNIPIIEGVQVKHCDIRYAIFYASIEEDIITLKNIVVINGEDFFKRFKQFQGKVLNKKLQIPLPSNFFISETKSSID